jgi:hypothetical protein
MNNQTSQHGKPAEQEGFEHRDLNAASIVYFLVTLGVATVLCLFVLKGLYRYLDHREKASQSPVNPLVADVPEDTRHVAPGYPQSAFPSPRLEEDERGQLNGIRLREEKTLYSYGWVDEKAGIVRIPIERAMDLLVERGLPVRPQGAGGEDSAADTSLTTTATAKAAAGAKDEKK